MKCEKNSKNITKKLNLIKKPRVSFPPNKQKKNTKISILVSLLRNCYTCIQVDRYVNNAQFLTS